MASRLHNAFLRLTRTLKLGSRPRNQEEERVQGDHPKRDARRTDAGEDRWYSTAHPANHRGLPLDAAARLPLSVRSNDAADAGRSGPHDVGSALYGSELSDLCVHVRPGGGSEPRVVGADDENLGVALQLSVREIGEGGLPADERRDGERRGGIDAVILPAGKTSVKRPYVGQPREEGPARKPFGKSHELALPVDIGCAVRREDIERVVNS